ncbi:MAG: hypothetical protein IJ600_05580, partial [Lachnospiraceae bacterium]|nr:hypothetical protein [Lachnospiraceae bacterium]
EHPQNVNMGRSVALHGENPLQKMSDEKVWKKFKEWQKDYVKLMDAYINDQTAENRHKLKKMGNTMQNYAKLVKLRGGFEDRWDHSQEIYSFAAVTRDMDKSLDKVSGPELKKVFHERMTDWSDLGAVGEWGASLVFSGGKWVANNLGGVLSTMNAEKNIVEQMQEAKGIDNVAIGFRWAGLLVSAYTTVKEGFMSAVTFGRRKKAMGIKKMNKEQPVEQQEKESAAKEGAAKEAAVKDNAVNDNTAIKESAKKEAVKENAVINGGKKEKAPEKKTEAKPGVNAAAEQVRPPEDQDQKQINAMAKLSKKSNAKKSWSHLSKFGFAAAGLGFTIAGFFGIACLPVTIAAGAVASVGVGVKYAVDYYRNKNTAKKAVDTQAKLEEENYKGQLDDKGHKIRYIDAKVAERRKMLIEKRSRFEGTNQSLKVLDEYIADDKKLKDRIRQNIAAENGKISIYSYADQVKRDYAMEAYRHVFLKDPDGPIDEENLLSEADVKKYCSLNKKDLADTKQDAKEARNRIMYRDLLQAEGLSVEAPKDVHEAKKLFEEKKKAKQRSEDKNAVQNKKKPVLH